MGYDSIRLKKLLKGACPRKISCISRLSGLTKGELRLMEHKWLDGMPDKEVCDVEGMSHATLTRHYNNAYQKIGDSFELYHIITLDSLPAERLLDYDGWFYRCQDELIRFFIRHNSEDKQRELYEYLKWINKI